MKHATPWNGIEFERTVLSGIFYNIRKITTESFDNYDHKTTLHYFSSTYHFQNQLVTTIVLSLSLSLSFYSVSFPFPQYFHSTSHQQMYVYIIHVLSISNPLVIPKCLQKYSIPGPSNSIPITFHISKLQYVINSPCLFPRALHTNSILIIQYNTIYIEHCMAYFIFFLAIIFTFQIYNHIDNTTWKCPFKIHSVTIPCVIPSIFYSN